MVLVVVVLCDARKKTKEFTVSSPADSTRRFSSEQSRREEAERLFQLAQTYKERQQLPDAAETMEEVADIAFDNPDAQYHAGMMNLQV